MNKRLYNRDVIFRATENVTSTVEQTALLLFDFADFVDGQYLVVLYAVETADVLSSVLDLSVVFCKVCST